MTATISIDDLIDIVAKGGKVKTGINVYNANGVLLLDREVLVEKTRTLEIIKENNITTVPFGPGGSSGVWDADGNSIGVTRDKGGQSEKKPPSKTLGHEDSISKKLRKIEELKQLAEEKYDLAKENIKKVLTDIKETGGEFDFDEVEHHVSDLVKFLTVTDNPFAYLTKEIFSYDDYLYNHSVNVCAIGTAVINRFNNNFSAMINKHLSAGTGDAPDPFKGASASIMGNYRYFQADELQDISTGFFLHDIGKVMIPDKILNKAGSFTPEEFELVKKHSHELGIKILEKNKLKNTFIKNIVQYHHGPLFPEEERCYPLDRQPADIPIYVKMCKLADIYDAMTSKRCYKEAFNQINVVTQIFRKYAGKDQMLQYALHAFVKSIGIYPPGSIVYLRNGQMAYVLDSGGPIVIPFTDTQGATLTTKPDPMDMGDSNIAETDRVDSRKSIKTPREVYNLLPPYLKPDTSG